MADELYKGGIKLEEQERQLQLPDAQQDTNEGFEQSTLDKTDNMPMQQNFTCPPNTFSYRVQPGETMFTIARKFNVSLDALIAANPQIPDPSRLVPGQTVCVPTGVPGGCPPNTFAYTVQPGDTMFTIARKFNVSLDALIAANPQITDPSRLVPGQTVCVPTGTMPPGGCPPNTFSYTVQPGDSMYTIAQRFNVSLDALIATNPQISDPSRIVPGQTVCVPTGTTSPSGCPPNTFVYTVQPGDTMFLIARRYGISLDALINANPQVANPNQIKPGQKLCVPTGSSGPCPPGSTTYTVRPGDSMYLIAQRFGVSLNSLIRANPQISDPSRITPGQTVCIPPR